MSTESDLKTLWIGDIEPWMNEAYLEDAFNRVGRVVGIKLMRNKDTGLPAGYCFIEFANRDQAEKILSNYNQKPIPGVQVTFRMNWGKSPNNISALLKQQSTQQSLVYQYVPSMIQQPLPTPPVEYSIYVGELELGINEQQLAEHFRVKYSSVTGSRIIIDPQTKMSRGFGFVKFQNQGESLKAIQEMNGSLFRGKYIKVSHAVNRQQQQQTSQQGPDMYLQQQQQQQSSSQQNQQQNYMQQYYQQNSNPQQNNDYYYQQPYQGPQQQPSQSSSQYLNMQQQYGNNMSHNNDVYMNGGQYQSQQSQYNINQSMHSQSSNMGYQQSNQNYNSYPQQYQSQQSYLQQQPLQQYTQQQQYQHFQQTLQQQQLQTQIPSQQQNTYQNQQQYSQNQYMSSSNQSMYYQQNQNQQQGQVLLQKLQPQMYQLQNAQNPSSQQYLNNQNNNQYPQQYTQNQQQLYYNEYPQMSQPLSNQQGQNNEHSKGNGFQNKGQKNNASQSNKQQQQNVENNNNNNNKLNQNQYCEFMNEQYSFIATQGEVDVLIQNNLF